MNDETIIRPGGRRPRTQEISHGENESQSDSDETILGFSPNHLHHNNRPQGERVKQAFNSSHQGNLNDAKKTFQSNFEQETQNYEERLKSFGRRKEKNEVKEPQLMAEMPNQTFSNVSYQISSSNRTETGTAVTDLVVPLLSMATKIKLAGSHLNIEEFKSHSIEQIKYFHSVNFSLSSNENSANKQAVEYASYGLCSMIDEIVLNTPWGQNSSWTEKSLLVIFHQQTWGGEIFFSNLEEMQKQPSNMLNVIALYFACLQLGFMGKYRSLPSGSNQLRDITTNTFNLIAQHQMSVDFTLSPNWRGVSDERSAIVKNTPFWVVLLVSLGLGFLIFLAFSLSIADKASWVNERLVQASMTKSLDITPANLYRLGTLNSSGEKYSELMEPDLIVPNVDYYGLFSELLKAEIEDRKVLIEDGDNEILIKFTSSNLFKSASHDLSDEFSDIVNKIGKFLSGKAIQLKVTGHTDSQPLRSVRYANNFELSEKRAISVRDIFVQNGIDDRSIRVVGAGDSQNIASNVTPEGRAKNRRVEIHLYQ